MAGVVKVLLATVTVASSVHSQDMTEGCTVKHGLNQLVFEETVTMLVAEPLDRRLIVWAQTPYKNHILIPTIDPQRLGKKNALPESWSLATIRLHPSLELTVGGHTLANGTQPVAKGPTRLFMENVLVMTNCPQGGSIWKMTSANRVVRFNVDKSVKLTIVAMEVAPLLVNLDNTDLVLCMKEKSFLQPCNDSYEELPTHVSLILQFIVSGTEYKVLVNGQHIMSQTWHSNSSRILTLSLIWENTTKPMYVVYPLPLTHLPTSQDPPVAAPVVVVMLSVVVAVLVVMLLLSLLWRCPALSSYMPCKRFRTWGATLHGAGHNGRTGQEAAICNTCKMAQPQPPTRPLNTLVDPQLVHIPEEPLDCEADYVMAHAVKPIEVQILKQQNVILGQISHEATASPWSTLTHSHKPASRKNSEGSHHTVSRQQSINTTHTFSSNYEDESDYMNVKVEDGVVRIHREPSVIYDTVDNTYDTVHDRRPYEPSVIYDTVDNLDYSHTGGNHY